MNVIISLGSSLRKYARYIFRGKSRDDNWIVYFLSKIVVSMLILAVVIGVVSAMVGINIPIDGGDEPTETTIATATNEPTPSPSPAPTLTPTSKNTADLEPNPNISYSDGFKKHYRYWLQRTIENETLTDVPVLATEYREGNQGASVLWVVYEECDGYEYVQHQRTTIAVDFANAVGTFDGDKPDRLRAVGVQNLNNYSNSITYIPTSSAEASFNGTLDRSTYTENWANRMRMPTETESDIAFEMVVNESGSVTAEEVFHEEYPLEESDYWCSDGSESDGGDGS